MLASGHGAPQPGPSAVADACQGRYACGSRASRSCLRGLPAWSGRASQSFVRKPCRRSIHDCARYNSATMGVSKGEANARLRRREHMARPMTCPACGATDLDVCRYDSMMVLRADLAFFTLLCPQCGTEGVCPAAHTAGPARRGSFCGHRSGRRHGAGLTCPTCPRRTSRVQSAPSPCAMRAPRGARPEKELHAERHLSKPRPGAVLAGAGDRALVRRRLRAGIRVRRAGHLARGAPLARAGGRRRAAHHHVLRHHRRHRGRPAGLRAVLHRPVPVPCQPLGGGSPSTMAA